MSEVGNPGPALRAPDLGSILRKAAEDTADATAIVAGPHRVTFAGLLELGASVSAALDAAGASPGEPVVLALPSGIPFLAAHHATVDRGAIAAPVPPVMPPGDLERVIGILRPGALITDPEGLRSVAPVPAAAALPILVLRLIGGGARPVLDIVREGSRAALDRKAGRSRPAPDDAAQIFLSSGSTGRPKAIALTHRQALLGIQAWTGCWGFDRSTVALMAAPAHHVVFNPLVLGTHLAGGCVVVPARLHPRAVAEEVARAGVTALMATPHFLRQVLADRRVEAASLDRVDQWIHGSAPMPRPVIEALVRRWPHGRPFNCYGLTETASALSCLRPEDLAGREDSVGRPHAMVEVRIRAEDGGSAPAGALGEVECRGPNVITGYFGSAEAEAGADAFAGGWFRTGDLGRLDAAGFLRLEGRTDERINVAGEKVHPAAVERVLHEHPDVADAAVKGVDDAGRGHAVKAWVVLRPGVALDPARLRAHCVRSLPPPFVPREFEFVAELPRSPAGKVLRRRLT